MPEGPCVRAVLNKVDITHGASMTCSAKVRAILSDGPATTLEIADELEMPRVQAMIYIQSMKRRRYVQHVGNMVSGTGKAGCPIVAVWDLTPFGRAAARQDKIAPRAYRRRG